MAYVMYEVN